MTMKGLSLSKFKKMREDKDWATLIHVDGHQLSIAKAPLSAIQRKQLEALEMADTSQINQGKFAQGGKVQRYEDGGSVLNSNGLGQQQAEEEAAQQKQISDANQLAQMHAPLQSSDTEVQDDDAPTKTTSDEAPASAVNPNTQAAAVSPSPPVATAATSFPQSQTTTAPSSVAPPLLGSQIAGLKEEQAAELERAKAVGQEGKAEAQAIGAIPKFPTTQDVIAKNQAKSDALYQAFMDKKVDPNAYWKDHSKLQAGIGVLISGLGQALGAGRAGENLALQNIDAQIQREVDRQKNDQDHSLNLYKLNRQALGDDISANLSAQSQLWTGVKYSLLKSAAESKAPIAQANAHLNIAKIDQIIGANNQKLALLSPTSDNPDPASRIQFLVPEGRQQKVVDEINAAKNTVANAPLILDAFEQAAKEARPLTGGFSTSPAAFIPGTETAGQKALLARLGPTFQDIEGNTRESTIQNFIKNVRPEGFDSDASIESKRKSLHAYVRSKSAGASASKSFGIDLSKYPSTDTSRIGLDNSQPSSLGSSPQIKISEGKKYMRGPNGEKILVK